MENRYYYAPATRQINESLFDKGYDEMGSAVENSNENRVYIIDTEDKLFWESDESQLDNAQQMADATCNQEVLLTDFNTISNWS